MTRFILALALALTASGCPKGHDHDGKSHGHDHDSKSGHDHDGKSGHDHGAHKTKAPAPSIVTSVKDPVCGMAVTTKAKHVVERDGKHHYFCSEACQKKFKAAPSKTAAEGKTEHRHDDGDHDHDH